VTGAENGDNGSNCSAVDRPGCSMAAELAAKPIGPGRRPAPHRTDRIFPDNGDSTRSIPVKLPSWLVPLPAPWPRVVLLERCSPDCNNHPFHVHSSRLSASAYPEPGGDNPAKNTGGGNCSDPGSDGRNSTIEDRLDRLPGVDIDP
jgi:hypothetical protein